MTQGETYNQGRSWSSYLAILLVGLATIAFILHNWTNVNVFVSDQNIYNFLFRHFWMGINVMEEIIVLLATDPLRWTMELVFVSLKAGAILERTWTTRSHQPASLVTCHSRTRCRVQQVQMSDDHANSQLRIWIGSQAVALTEVVVTHQELVFTVTRLIIQDFDWSSN